MKKFSQIFTIGNQEHSDLVYIGWHLQQDSMGIRVSQNNYLKRIEAPNMDRYRVRDGEEMLGDDGQTQFR